jgi:rSAM/selenodomain-associated transferase 1
VSVAIGLIAKSPVAGEVKTRLCPPLSPAEAATVAADLLLDTASNAAATGHAVVCVHHGEADPLRALLGPRIALLAQRGDGLGARLAAAQADLHGQGHDRVLLLGADCPTADPDLLRVALAALDDADVVFGPAADGGYTMIGTRAPTPHLFPGVAMGTAAVLEQTLALARAAGTKVALVGERHDLDVAADFAAALRAGQLDRAPRSRRHAERLRELDPYCREENFDLR